jgi:hypothetical protein
LLSRRQSVGTEPWSSCLKRLTGFRAPGGFRGWRDGRAGGALVVFVQAHRHFHSRDELFNLFIEYVVDKILASRFFLHNKALKYEERYLLTFAAILHELGGMGFRLLSDLRNNLPELWDKVRATYNVWEEELYIFFKEGIELGVVHDVNPAILAHMIILFFRELMTPEYLQSLKMTLAEAFMETFKIQVRSIVKNPDYSPETMEERMRTMFPELAELFRQL